MTSHQDVFGLIHSGGESRRPPLVGMQFLHERAMRPRNVVTRSAFLKSQDFISFIFRHRAAAARPSASRPRVSVAITCTTPAGKTAVKINLKMP